LKGEGAKSALNARARAIRVLTRVEATEAFLNTALDLELRKTPGDPRDAALITELCYGVMRRQMALDQAIARFSDRRLNKLEHRVIAALRVGVYQLFYLRLPRRAAVAETVNALKQLQLVRAAGFANAVLRKLAEADRLPLPPDADPLEHWSLRESHPPWLIGRWSRLHGLSRAVAMAEADNRSPATVIRANSKKTSREDLLDFLRSSGIGAQPTRWAHHGVVLPPVGPIEELPGYHQGVWQVQDEAAQLVVEYAAVADGSRVLDVCAAPGGKACQLAERVAVVACDLHPAKLQKIRAEATRLGVASRIELLAHDATRPFPQGLGQFDLVLVDAPCSGLGTLRRHPELRYRRKEADIAELAALQRGLLDNCQAMVGEGGLLLYAVCSTEPEEGSEQVSHFLRTHPEFELEPPPNRDSGLPLVNGCLQTFPGPEGWDGFFAARFRHRPARGREGGGQSSAWEADLKASSTA
jgi:16S rRNA (cytosine967-C5)-methyltransferase